MPEISPFLETVTLLCLMALMATAGMCLYRIVIGPNAGDRAIALDVLTMAFCGFVCVVCIAWDTSLYFDAVWILTLVGYLGSAAIARYLEKGRVF